MGDIADYYNELYYMDKAMYFNFEGESCAEMVWTTKDNEKILIKNMTYPHLQNAKLMLERKGLTDIIQYKRLIQEIKSRDAQTVDKNGRS